MKSACILRLGLTLFKTNINAVIISTIGIITGKMVLVCQADQTGTFTYGTNNSNSGTSRNLTEDRDANRMLTTLSNASTAASTAGAPPTPCPPASPMTYPKSNSGSAKDINLGDQIGMRVQNENGNCGIYATYQGIQGVYNRAGYRGYIDPNEVFTKTVEHWSKASNEEIVKHQKAQSGSGIKNSPFLLGLSSEDTFRGLAGSPDGYQTLKKTLGTIHETANNSQVANNPETNLIDENTGKQRTPEELRKTFGNTAGFLKEMPSDDPSNLGAKTPSLKDLGVTSVTAYAPSSGEYQDDKKSGYKSGFPDGMDINEKDQIMDKVSRDATVKQNANRAVASKLDAALERNIPVRLEINSKYLDHHETGLASGHAAPDSRYKRPDQQGTHAVTVYGRFKAGDGKTYYRVADSNYTSQERDRMSSGKPVGARLISADNLYDAQRMDIFLSKNELKNNPWK